MQDSDGDYFRRGKLEDLQLENILERIPQEKLSLIALNPQNSFQIITSPDNIIS